MSHDFVRDREVQELRRRFGHWMSDVWLEMLAEADKNEGQIRGSYDLISRSLSWVSLSERPNIQAKYIRNALDYMEEVGWIEPRNGFVLVRNYSEYHKSREHKKSRTGINTLPSEPSLPSEPIYTPYKVPPTVSPKAPPNSFATGWARWPNKVKRGAAEKAAPKALKRAGGIGGILAGLDRTMAYITREGGKFMPNPATWLSAAGWEDEPPESADDQPRYHWEKP